MPKPPNPLLPPETPFRPTAAGLLRWASAQYGDRDAVVTATDRVTYVELEARSRDLAKQLLAAGVPKGARIAIQFPNGVDFCVAWFAVARIGGIVVPLSTFYPAPELRKVLRLSDAHLLLTPPELLGRAQEGFVVDALPSLAGAASATTRPIFVPEAPMLREVWFVGGAPADGATPPWARRVSVGGDPAATGRVPDAVLEALEAEVTPADWVTMIHTSGTTSDPKGVIHTNGTITRQGWLHAGWWGYGHDDRLLSTMALFWIGGLGQRMLPTLCRGGAILFQEKPDAAAAVELAVREKVTKIGGYGARAITSHPSFATAAVTDELRHNLAEEAKPPQGTSYGMTETAAIMTTIDWGEQFPEEQRGSQGRPVPGVQVRIVDPETGEPVPDGELGTLQVRGHIVMAAMNKRERESVFEADGWYDTGDRCVIEHGLVWFRGRYNEMIKTAGANVAPLEVEEALRKLPGVAEVAVLGVPDDERGQAVAAAIVPARGATLDPADLARRLRELVSAYKVPRRWLVAAPGTLPTLANGKPDRLAIARLLADQAVPA